MNETTVYFGYGSNLWKHQMIQRCPTSKYLGIARLNGYRWIINGRGYANVVQNSYLDDFQPNEVWGLVYSLQPNDEANLDINEGVPVAYTKENLIVDYWPASWVAKPDVHLTPEKREMLVYIDLKRVTPEQPKKEYIFRMNKGIEDATKEGMPKAYVDDVMRRFIPDVRDDDETEKFARKQASLFRDED